MEIREEGEKGAIWRFLKDFENFEDYGNHVWWSTVVVEGRARWTGQVFWLASSYSRFEQRTWERRWWKRERKEKWKKKIKEKV